jgi:hypothetical protein
LWRTFIENINKIVATGNFEAKRRKRGAMEKVDHYFWDYLKVAKVCNGKFAMK